MKYNAETHHRRSIRLQNFDYSAGNTYFVTLCIQARLCLLGNIENQIMKLNSAGNMILHFYLKLEEKFPNVKCDEFICMPNHVHFLISVGADACVRTALYEQQIINNQGRTHGCAPTITLGNIVQWFKTMTTNEYIKGVKEKQWASFNGKLWQRNYWERVVRNENELNDIRQYIIDNPSQWQNDDLFP